MSPRTNDPPQKTSREIYRQILGIDDPARREQLLSSLCGESHELRSKVLNLLTARESAERGLLARAVGDSNGVATRDEGDSEGSGSFASSLSYDTHGVDPSDCIGQEFGPYQLIEQLGQGGMGTVFLARQAEPVVRDVALKVIRSDVASPGVIKRFEAERQILAMMSHPNIAQVFDAGTTPEGLPYFVMELVRGVPLTEYCQQHTIELAARLRLFIDLCRAVEHAHQKGAVHRDLKPANILVVSPSNFPIIKVIDFGVAKALSPDLNADTPVTHSLQLVGTPLYMAPEQMRMQGEMIDVRTDVYSLGILLYELLTGAPPYRRTTLTELGLSGFLNLLENQTPPLPSQHSSLRGRKRQRELDWITLKAISFVPGERYPTAGALADDLQRFLNNETVAAGPPTKLYAVGKWWRRNTSIAGLVGLVAISLIFVSLILISQIHFARSIQRSSVENRQRDRQWQETARLQQAFMAFKDADLKTLRQEIEDHASERQLDTTLQKDQRCYLENLFVNAGSPQPDAVFADSAQLGPMAFSASASRIVAASDEGEVSLYGIDEHGEILPIARLGAHPDRVDSIAISPDGTRAVTGSSSGSLWFWDLEKRGVVKKVSIVDAGIQSLAWSPNGKYLAAGARYELAWVGDGEGNEVFRVINNHRHESVLFSGDSRSLFIPTRQGVDEYEILTGDKLRSLTVLPFEHVRTLCLGGPAEEWLIVGERYNESLMVIDIESGQQLGVVNINGRYPQKLAATGDGTWISLLYPDRSVELVHLSTGLEQKVAGRSHLFFPTVEFGESIPENSQLSLLWLESQERMVVSGGGQPTSVWSRKNVQPLHFPKVPYPLVAAFPHGENQLLCIRKSDLQQQHHPISVSLEWDLDEVIGDPIPFQIFSSSKRLENGFAILRGNELIRIIDNDSGTKVVDLNMPFVDVEGLRVIANTNTVAATDGQRIVVWQTRDDWRKHQVIGDFDVDAETNMVLTSDGETIIGVNSGHLCELASRTGKIKWVYEPKSKFLSSICLSPNEDLLAVALRADIEIWDRRTHELLHSFSGVSEAMSMCFTPDQRTLLVGNRDGSISAWQLSIGRSLGVLYQATSAMGIIALQFVPNSTQILAWNASSSGIEPIVLGQAPHREPSIIPAMP